MRAVLALKLPYVWAKVTSSMKGVTKGMEKSLASMDIDQISKIMDKFEQAI
jgi:division protein CdvB (Snf7/Vps24/ESCRT-III family)